MRAVDVFAPRPDQASPEDRRRARFAIGMALGLTPVMALLAAAQFVSGNPQGGAGSATIGLALGLAPFFYRRWGRLEPLVHGILGFAWAALLYIAISSRGAGINAATVGLAELPLFAVLLTGMRGGGVWAAITCVSELVLAVLGGGGVLVEKVPREGQLFVEYSALVLITLTLFAVGVMYEVRRRQALIEVAEQDRALREAERRQVQAETDAKLAHAEKLATIGRVTAAVAHEINNPLSCLGMNLRFLREELAGSYNPDELERALADSIDGVSRIAHLVTRLRSYARGDADTPEVGATDLAVALDRARKLAEPHTRGRATVHTEVGALPHAKGQERALVQVFLNLLVNAAQALPEGRVGDNRIQLRARQRDGWLEVEVEDNGAGIPPEVLGRIGEPFFSTKPIGEGTGLGVAVSRSTVRAIGGKLAFQSEPGRTVARVLLPVAAAPAPASSPERRRDSSAFGAPEGAEVEAEPVESLPGSDLAGLRILIVDDDDLVARSLQRVLTAHEITAVSSGARALDVLRERSDFDLILCDLMMPGMTGMDLYEVVAEAYPELVGRIVFSTGGAFTDEAREFCERHAARVLGKPVSVEALTRILAEAVDGRPDHAAASG